MAMLLSPRVSFQYSYLNLKVSGQHYFSRCSQIDEITVRVVMTGRVGLFISKGQQGMLFRQLNNVLQLPVDQIYPVGNKHLVSISSSRKVYIHMDRIPHWVPVSAWILLWLWIWNVWVSERNTMTGWIYKFIVTVLHQTHSWDTITIVCAWRSNNLWCGVQIWRTCSLEQELKPRAKLRAL